VSYNSLDTPGILSENCLCITVSETESLGWFALTEELRNAGHQRSGSAECLEAAVRPQRRDRRQSAKRFFDAKLIIWAAMFAVAILRWRSIVPLLKDARSAFAAASALGYHASLFFACLTAALFVFWQFRLLRLFSLVRQAIGRPNT
jgi:hypothetical protein